MHLIDKTLRYLMTLQLIKLFFGFIGFILWRCNNEHLFSIRSKSKDNCHYLSFIFWGYDLPVAFFRGASPGVQGFENRTGYGFPLSGGSQVQP